MKYVTTAALAIHGDRVEPGTEIELTEQEAARFDPADLKLADGTTPAAPAEAAPTKDVADMSAAELKERAAELGLPTTGTKADLLERISLHLDGTTPAAPAEGDATEQN